MLPMCHRFGEGKAMPVSMIGIRRRPKHTVMPAMTRMFLALPFYRCILRLLMAPCSVTAIYSLVSRTCGTAWGGTPITFYERLALPDSQ